MLSVKLRSAAQCHTWSQWANASGRQVGGTAKLPLLHLDAPPHCHSNLRLPISSSVFKAEKDVAPRGLRSSENQNPKVIFFCLQEVSEHLWAEAMGTWRWCLQVGVCPWIHTPGTPLLLICKKWRFCKHGAWWDKLYPLEKHQRILSAFSEKVRWREQSKHPAGGNSGRRGPTHKRSLHTSLANHASDSSRRHINSSSASSGRWVDLRIETPSLHPIL